MNVLFLSLTSVNSLDQHNIYTDLLREFARNGHKIHTVSPVQRRYNEPTHIINGENASILKVRTGNITKAKLIEKGISTVLLSSQFISAIKKYYKGISFDLIIYPTPPITLDSVVGYFKKRDNAKTYLMLKDIFPQNAIDINMMSKSGIKGIIYKYFCKKEKKLYAISDRIGCMSQANVDYLLQHNPEISPDKVEVCPNSIEIQDMSITEQERVDIRNKYGIPLDKKVFVYGGNLGRPQGIPHLIECLKAEANNPDAYFLVVGDGTEFGKLQTFFDEAKPQNMKLMKRLPKEDYDRMVAACDVGMIFLDHRFTIPNFPSRLLAYMQAGLPVLACTDPNTDVGKVIANGGFGWWCESNDVEAFGASVSAALVADHTEMKQKELEYLKNNYTVEKEYEIIMK